MPGIYGDNAPQNVNGSDVERQLGLYLRNRRANKAVMLGEIFTWRAAWYMMTGRNLPNDGNQPVNYAKLANIAQQLKTHGSMEYAKMAWLNTTPAPRPQELNYDVFLSNVWDQISLAPYMGVNYDGHREGLRAQVQNRRGLSCVEYQADAARNADNRENRRYHYSDKSTYEYEAPENMWREYTAISACLQGRGNEPLDEQKIAETKENAVDYLVMKNRQTVEKLQNREYLKVREEYKKTLNSFTFNSLDDLRAAQRDSRLLYERMNAHGSTPLSESPEWKRVVHDLQGFREAATPEEAAQYSADLLVAAEKFTKGRKSLYASEEEQRLVRETLSAIAVAIPDAVNNPSVKPLINRFNSVRKARFQEKVRLRDYHRPCSVDRYQNLPQQTRGKKIQPVKSDREMQEELYTEVDPVTGEVPKARPVQQQNGQRPQAEDQPVPMNLVQPKPKELNPQDVDVAPMDADNEIQAFMYGEEQPDLAKDHEEMSAKPIKLAKAYEDAGDVMNLLKTLPDETLAGFDKDFYAAQLAKVLALAATKPYSDAPDMIDKNALKVNAENLKNDPVVQEIAKDLAEKKGRRDDFRNCIKACENQTQKDKNVRFVEYCDSAYEYYQQKMKKAGNEKEEDMKVPQDKKPSIKAEPEKKPSVKPKEDPKDEDQKEEKKEEKQEERDSDISVSYVSQDRYTQVSM